MTYDFEWTEGFDKYAPVGTVITTVTPLAGEWTTLSAASATISFQASLLGSGVSFKMSMNNTVAAATLTKTLPGNYARHLGSLYFNSPLLKECGFQLNDSGTNQVQVQVNTAGTISAFRNGTLLGTTSTSVSASSTHCLQWDITINNTTGIVKLWLDGVSVLSLTGQNTRASANNSANSFVLFQNPSAVFTGVEWDHIWLAAYTSSGGTDTPPLTNPVIETQFPSSDSSVQFSPVNTVLGQFYILGSTNAPGANELFLRKFTPSANMTINSVSCWPGATSAGANFKAVVYTDSGGAPNTLLSSGVQATGTTSGTELTGTLVTPQALTSGTTYWIGFITDTSVVLNEVDGTTTGAKAANTYASGAPSTAPAMTTGQPSWLIIGNCTSAAANWTQVSNLFTNPPLGDAQYNSDNTVNHEDLYGFPGLSVSGYPIYTVGLKVICERSDAGARTVDLRTKSSSTDSAGSNAGQTPATSYGWLNSYFDTDPNGAIPWTQPALDAATSGIKIAS